MEATLNIIKCVDLDLFSHYYEVDDSNNHIFKSESSSDSCERISYCSCDCNYCSVLL